MSYLNQLLGKNERIVLRARRHWTTLLGVVLINGGLMIVLLAVGAALAALDFGGPQLRLLLLAPILLLALIPLIRLIIDGLRWSNEVYVLTNRRIVQVEGVINKHTVDSSLDKINDVVLNQSALGRLLGYGDLEILTASELGINQLSRLADAIKFKTEMLNQKEAMHQLESIDSAAAQATAGPPSAADVPELIGELDGLRAKGLITDNEFEEKKARLLGRI